MSEQYSAGAPEEVIESKPAGVSAEGLDEDVEAPQGAGDEGSGPEAEALPSPESKEDELGEKLRVAADALNDQLRDIRNSVGLIQAARDTLSVGSTDGMPSLDIIITQAQLIRDRLSAHVRQWEQLAEVAEALGGSTDEDPIDETVGQASEPGRAVQIMKDAALGDIRGALAEVYNVESIATRLRGPSALVGVGSSRTEPIGAASLSGLEDMIRTIEGKASGLAGKPETLGRIADSLEVLRTQ